MITQCAVRTPQGIIPVDAPATLSQQQEACAAAGADFHDAQAGFLTESGVFLTRTEAVVHAAACGQLSAHPSSGPYLSWDDLQQ